MNRFPIKTVLVLLALIYILASAGIIKSGTFLYKVYKFIKDLFGSEDEVSVPESVVDHDQPTPADKLRPNPDPNKPYDGVPMDARVRYRIEIAPLIRESAKYYIQALYETPFGMTENEPEMAKVLESLHDVDQVIVFMQQYQDLMDKGFWNKHLTTVGAGVGPVSFHNSINFLDNHYESYCVRFKNLYPQALDQMK